MKVYRESQENRILKENNYIIRINDPEKHTFQITSVKLDGLVKHLEKIGKQLNPEIKETSVKIKR